MTKPSSTNPTAGSSMIGMLLIRSGAQLVVFITIVILSRLLGPAGFGQYSFLFGYLMFFTLFNVNGLNDILVREMASRPSERDSIYRNGLALKLFAGLIAFVLATTGLTLFPVEGIPWWLGCLAALTLFFSFSMGSSRLVWDVPFQVDFRMTAASLVNFASKFLFLAILVIWIGFYAIEKGTSPLNLPATLFAGSVVIVVIMQIVSEAAGTAIQGGLNLKLNYPMLPRWNPAMVRYLYREVWTLAIAGGLMMVYGKVNLLLIQAFMTSEDLGWYAAPMRVVEALYIIPATFIAGMMPILSQAYRASVDGFYRLVRLSYKLMLLASFPVASLVFFYREPVIALIYGQKYAESIPVVAVFIWITVIGFSVIVFYGVLIASGKQRTLTVICLIQAVLAVIISAILIKPAGLGIVGAAWGHTIAHFVMFPAALLFRDTRRGAWLWFRSLGVPLTASLLACMTSRWLGLGLFAAIPFVAIIFMGLTLLTGWLNRSDLRQVRKLVGYRGNE